MSERLFKVLSRDGSACHGGSGSWPLPDGKPGEWVEVKGELVPCRNGLHLCRPADLLRWFGPAIFVAEHDDKEVLVCDDKIVVRRARLVATTVWDDRVARLFAADCAERVLPIFERKHPNDDRPRKAIEVARASANGEIGAAAWNAAWAAARAAARAAAGDAEWAAAGAAAGAAAWDAAWAAAGDAARAAAGAAAGAAARAAAGDAEWAAARAAAEEWQTQRLMDYLDGGKGPE